MNSTAFQEYITYNEDYHILICHSHGFAIPPDGVQRHFREFHKTISIDVRNQIIQHAKSLSLVKPEDISTPSGEIKSIDCLKLITNGWQCQFNDCLHCTTTQGAMIEHCKVKHGRKKGQQEIWQSQAIQTFFQGPHRRYDRSRYHMLTIN